MKHAHKEISGGLAALLFFLAFASSCLAGPLRIGVLLPLSGDYAAYGKLVANGFQMAAEDLMDPAPEIVFEDTGTIDPKKIALAARVLLDVRKIDLGVVMLIDDAETIGPIFNAHKIPLLVL